MVGASWLMSSLSASPLVIALVQTFTTLPVFLFALPAGALADIFNRRTILLIANIMMLLSAAIFSWVVYKGIVTINLLLIFTFVLGVGAALMSPAWQAAAPKIVPPDELPQAIALSGLSMNISRAIGPPLAGVFISTYGITSPFIANAISFLAISMALLWWKYEDQSHNSTLPPERVWQAIKIGIRHACNSKPLLASMWHVLGFMFFANAFWALMPLISKIKLAGGAVFFGIMMGGIGFGAVCGAILLPKLKEHLNANQLVVVGTVLTASMTAYFSFMGNQISAIVASFAFGMGWIFVLVSINVSAQQALPDWVRARGLSVFIMVFFGGMSLGTFFWGWLATHTSIETALLSASIGGVVFIFLSYRATLQQGADVNFSASHHWPLSFVYKKIPYDIGPVIIQIYYQIEESDREKFLKAIYHLGMARKRNGAFKWGIYEDVEFSGSFIEHFMEDSWAAHMRHHDRVTHADKKYQDIVATFHQGESPPKVKHFISRKSKK